MKFFSKKMMDNDRDAERAIAGEVLREIYEDGDELFCVTPDTMEFEMMLKLMFQYDAEPVNGNQLMVKLPNGQRFRLTLTAEEAQSDVPVF